MTNRNRKALSQDVFGRLYDAIEKDGDPVRDKDQPRWIAKASEQDSDFMAKAKLEKLILSRRVRACLIFDDSNKFLVVTGLEFCNEVDGIRLVDLTPSLFHLAVTDLDLFPHSSGAAIRDDIEGLHKHVSGYDGHDLSAVARHFPMVSCLELASDLHISTMLTRLVGVVVSTQYEDGPLFFDNELRQTLVETFSSGNDYIPFDLVLQGSLAFSWSSFFIELYRCVEQLYAVPRLSDLVKEMGKTSSLRDVAEMLERNLSWRPKEDEALAKLLLTGCKESTLIEAIEGLSAARPPFENPSDMAAKLIYRLRNNHVHYRPITKSQSMSEEKWNLVIKAILNIVVELYDRFGSSFHEPDGKLIA